MSWNAFSDTSRRVNMLEVIETSAAPYLEPGETQDECVQYLEPPAYRGRWHPGDRSQPFLQSPYDLFAGDHRLALRPGDRVRECLFQRALLGLEAMELVYLHIPKVLEYHLRVFHTCRSLPETLVDQAMLPECPEPIVPQEVQCLLAEVLPQDVLHVRDVLRKRGKVGEEPALAGSWAPFPLFCPGASASTSEAPVVGVGAGHLVRTTSIA